MKESICRDFAYAACYDCGYNEANKARWHKAGQAFFKALAKDLGAPLNTVRWNPGGIAVSGDHTLCWPEGGVYVHASLAGFSTGYYRGCSVTDRYGTSMRYPNNTWHAPRNMDDYERLLSSLKNLSARAKLAA